MVNSKNEERFYSKNEETEGSPLGKVVLVKSVKSEKEVLKGRKSCRFVRFADRRGKDNTSLFSNFPFLFDLTDLTKGAAMGFRG